MNFKSKGWNTGNNLAPLWSAFVYVLTEKKFNNVFNSNQFYNYVLELQNISSPQFSWTCSCHQHCESALFLKMFTLRIFFKSCLYICCKFIWSEIVGGVLTPWINIVLITEHWEGRKNERVFKTNFLAISCFQSYLTFLGNVACQISSRGGKTTAQFNL